MRTARFLSLAVVSAVGVVALSGGTASATRVKVPTPRCNDISVSSGHLPGGKDVSDLKDPYEYVVEPQMVAFNAIKNGPKDVTGVVRGKSGKGEKSGVKRKSRHAVGGPIKLHHGAPIIKPAPTN